MSKALQKESRPSILDDGDDFQPAKKKKLSRFASPLTDEAMSNVANTNKSMDWGIHVFC